MKKVISVFVALSLVFSICGCSKAKKEAWSSGYDAGYSEGYRVGYNKGYGEGSNGSNGNYKTEEPQKEEEYIGNVNTKKFHKSSCSYLPDEDNREYFDTIEEAEDNGYKPCQKCNPEE